MNPQLARIHTLVSQNIGAYDVLRLDHRALNGACEAQFENGFTLCRKPAK